MANYETVNNMNSLYYISTEVLIDFTNSIIKISL